MKKYTSNNAFTLIELLVVISIIVILVGVSIFGLGGARESARDARRKGDLELIKGGLEIYKSDCRVYPATLGSSLSGSGTPASCSSSNSYIPSVPDDPLDPTRTYRYAVVGNGYELCASLEQTGLPTVTCGGSSSCGTTCNYKVISP